MRIACRWQIAIVLATSVFSSVPTFAQSVSAREQAVDLTRAVRIEQADLRNSIDPTALARLSTLVEERRSVMAALVTSEPASFLSLAMSNQLRQALPASLRNRIEERAEIEGALEVTAEDYDWGSIVRYHVRTQSGQRVAVHFASNAPRLRSDQQVRIRGVLLDVNMAVASGTTDVEVMTGTLSYSSGEQRTLLMLVNFTDNMSQPFSIATATDVLNSVNSFYRENSQNQTWISGDVVGWFTVGLSAAGCDPDAIMNAAKARAGSAGVDLSRYRRFAVTFPQNGCGWAGLGDLGGSVTGAWLPAAYLSTRTLGHELGHNLGLFHAHALECGTSTLGSSCSSLEYGNPVDIMGYPGVVGHFNAYEKEQFGWLGSQLLPVTSAGTFTLSPYATTLSDLKVLRILKSTSGSVATNYYVEYRHGANFDGAVPPGVFIHTGVAGSGDTSFVLDMTPETDSWSDAALPVGRTFTDSASGVSLTTVAIGTGGATVRVDFNGRLPPPCSYSLSQSSQSIGAAGGVGSVTLTTGSDCAWRASSNASWLQPSATSGVGSITLQYTAAANTTSSSRTGTITIGDQPFTVTQAAATVSVNRAPVMSQISAQKVVAGGTISFTISARDPDGDVLTYSASNLPNGAVLDAKTGAFRWTTTSSQVGTYAVTFRASDGQLSASQTVKLTVSKPNRRTSQ